MDNKTLENKIKTAVDHVLVPDNGGLDRIFRRAGGRIAVIWTM